jgi:hypothetical protein
LVKTSRLAAHSRLIKNVKRGNTIYHLAGKVIDINPIYVKYAVSILVKLLEIPESKQINIDDD